MGISLSKSGRCKGIAAIRKSSLTSRTIAKHIAEFASDKKALDIVILDMRKLVNYCDYFVICSGTTDRHVRGIADGIDDGLDEMGLSIGLKQGLNKSDWVVLDTGDVVIHIFEQSLRDFYRLDYLWKEAKEVVWQKPDKSKN